MNDAIKKPRQGGDIIVAHPLPVRPSRYRTVLHAARAAAQPRPAPRHTNTILNYLKGSQK